MKQVLIRRGLPVVAEVPAPQASDDTILVRVAFSLISTGTETASLSSSGKSLLRQSYEEPAKIAQGLQLVQKVGVRRAIAIVNGELEAARETGYSCSGTVISCGRNITGFSAGDRIACAGANKANHAEIVAVPKNLAIHVPEGCDLESAASATLGAIALQGVRRADLRLGENVAVIGLGLVGQITAQLLRTSGCRTVGIDPDTSRVLLANSLGLTLGVEDQSDGVQAVLNFTEGRGADAVIIAASSDSGEIIQQAMRMVRKKGRVVIVGAVPVQVDRSPWYEKEADLLISSSYGPGRYDTEYEQQGKDYPFAYVRWTENRNMAEYLRLISEGKVDFRRLIGRVWALNEAPEAYSDLKQNKHIAVLLSNAASTEPSEGPPPPKPVLKHSNGLIRTGVVGPGSFTRSVHLPNLKRLHQQFSISAIASQTGVNAINVARQYDAAVASTSADELFADPELDLILISSRHDLHAPQAIRAAEQGKAVLLEKPAALTKSELDQLINAFETSGSMLVVGFNRRFSPLIRETKAVTDRRAGPLFITYRMNAGRIPPESWIHGPQGGGRIIGEACHIFDLFNHIVGRFPEEVTALPLRPSAGGSVSDNFAATLRYPDGSLCNLTYTSLGSAELGKESMEIFFDGKTIVLDDYRKLVLYGCIGKTMNCAQPEKGHLEELQSIATYLSKKGPLPMTLKEIEAATNISFLVDGLVRSASCVES
jgi:predicted dehydrogenase